MISRRTKIQLVIFVVITLTGVSFVGARYARLDRLVLDTQYSVTAHFQDSGGIFQNAEVSYRGVKVGQVGKLTLTKEGVDVELAIDNKNNKIPATGVLAVVGNRSAVGEQYIDLQPASDKAPYLKDGSQIALDDTRIPIESNQLLLDTDRLVNSVNKQSLATVISEFGSAFNGTGDDLATLIDSSTEFIQAANDNFDVTTALIRDSSVVLQTQADKASAIKAFSKNLALVSDTLAASDANIRTIIANGSATANQLRTFLEDNKVDLGQLINNLVTTGEIAVKHIDGTRMILILYPYVAAGAYVVVDKTPATGIFDAHFGMILTQDPPLCIQGYDQSQIRSPSDGSNAPMNENARCTEPATKSNPRGAQYAPRVAPGSSRVVATYDRSTGKVSYGTTQRANRFQVLPPAGMAGGDSWKWLLLNPLAAR